MESPKPASPYIPRSAKEREFAGGSSSMEFKEADVLGMSPPVNCSSVPKSSKQKEVIHHEIIDVEMEEDCGDVMLVDGEVDRTGKGKEPLPNFSVNLDNFANDGSGSDRQTSNNGIVDDVNSNLFYGEDGWIDTYYDDIVYDDYDVMQSHYDHLNIPPGVEMPFPWLPSGPQNDPEMPVTNTLSGSILQTDSNVCNLPSDLSSSHSSRPMASIRIREQETSSSLKRGTQSSKHLKGKTPSGIGLKKPDFSSGKMHLSSESVGGSSSHKTAKEPFELLGKGKRRFHRTNLYSIQYGHCPSGATFPSDGNNQSGYTTSSMQTKTPGVGTYVPLWEDLPLNMSEPFMGSSVAVNERLPVPLPGDSDDATPAIRAEHRNLDVILQEFDHFKKFDTVECHSDHHYSEYGSYSRQAPKDWAKRIQEEWKILEEHLPETIFVRVYESRLDLLRAVIVGAEGTPYHDGLFFFDIFFPSSYPDSPPHVYYHSGGLRINPNLYHNGKVCLSLLNTWSGAQNEQWIPRVSTVLQVLVSIQGLILNAKPFFNEPGYDCLMGSEGGEVKSLDYNEKTFIYSLQTMLYNMRRPPKYFEDFVIGHFCKHARDILLACKAYLNGTQVGYFVKGSVQDVDEGDKSCSQYLRTSLAGFITTLVNTFSQIGAKDCEEFLRLAQKGKGPVTDATVSGPKLYN